MATPSASPSEPPKDRNIALRLYDAMKQTKSAPGRVAMTNKILRFDRNAAMRDFPKAELQHLETLPLHKRRRKQDLPQLEGNLTDMDIGSRLSDALNAPVMAFLKDELQDLEAELLQKRGRRQLAPSRRSARVAAAAEKT
ncbi:MAG: hypothetical protein M1816_002489 [Peltula sp. TS41687]|nr:MAG: hypothetical protein M1816_002489 [Peltula sp. TS41687]